jgi:DNA-binding MarR family transcriptional regulator
MRIEDEVKGHFRNDNHKALINLIFTVNQLNYQFRQNLKEHDLTEPQYNVLRVLKGFRSEKSISIGFIKERMLDKNPDVSRIVDGLLAKGLLNRKENPDDRRQKSVEITEKGIALLTDMLEFDKKTENLLACLNADELNELNRILDKIRG